MHAPTTPRRPFADALRAGAIGLVVASHVAGSTWRDGTRHAGHRPVPHWLYDLDPLGDVGVAVLFTLSGYLLAGPFLRALLRAEPSPDARTFAWKRFLRIYPLYATAVLLVAGLRCAAARVHLPVSPVGFADVATHLVFVHDFFFTRALSIEAPLWTMAADVEFYLALPLLAAVLAPWMRRLRARDRPRVLFALAVTIVAASTCVRIATYRATTPADFAHEVVLLQNVLGLAPFFLGGAFCAWTEIDGVGEPNAARAWTCGIAAGVITLVFLACEIRAPILDAISPAAWRWYESSTVIVRAAVAMLWIAALRAVPAGRLRAAFSAPATTAAATLSYGIYLFHVPVLFVLSSLSPRLPDGAAFALLLVGGTATTTLLVVPLHLAIEAPFLRRKARL